MFATQPTFALIPTMDTFSSYSLHSSLAIKSSRYVSSHTVSLMTRVGHHLTNFLFLFAQYSIHAVVAGTVGTWWFEPDECGFCSSAVNNSFIRTYTTSFGSICFGGFVVAVIQALRMLANSARANGDGNFLVCIAECILACLASIIEYLNKWAFVYVG